MQHDFQVVFRVSRWRRVLLLVLAMWCAAVLVAYFWGATFCLLMLLLCCATFWAWRDPNPVRHLWVDGEYQAWLLLHHDEDLHAATLLSGSLIHRWGCFLKWQCAGRVFWQMVLPDMLDGDAFRRLRVWAVFGQKL